jgi:hypothetical protein
MYYIIKRLYKLNRQIIHILLEPKFVLLYTNGKKNTQNFLIKKILKNVINLTHDNFNTQIKAIKIKCKQIIKKSLNPKVCILFR